LCSSHLIRICVFHQSSKERRKDVCSCRLRMDVMVVVPGHWAVLLGSCPPPCGCSTQRLRLPRLLPTCDGGDALPQPQPTLVSSLAPLLHWVMAVVPRPTSCCLASYLGYFSQGSCGGGYGVWNFGSIGCYAMLPLDRWC
jgi:hypothetical protein